MADWKAIDDAYDAWSDEQKGAYSEVANGIANGDLQPLAEYFRAGFFELEGALALELADMIDAKDGLSDYRLAAIGRTKRPIGWSKKLELLQKHLTIGTWVEREIQNSPRGAYPGIIADAVELFGVGTTTVTTGHSELKKRLKGAVPTGFASKLDFFLATYSADFPKSPE